MVPSMDIEGALGHLHIKYRKKSLPNETIYFCDDLQHTSFNLVCMADGSIHLWSFLLTDIAAGHVGKKVEETQEGCVTGLEITEDNILNFYVLEKVNALAPPKSPLDIITDFMASSIRIQEHFRYLTYS